MKRDLLLEEVEESVETLRRHAALANLQASLRVVVNIVHTHLVAYSKAFLQTHRTASDSYENMDGRGHAVYGPIL